MTALEQIRKHVETAKLELELAFEALRRAEEALAGEPRKPEATDLARVDAELRKEVSR